MKKLISYLLAFSLIFFGCYDKEDESRKDEAGQGISKDTLDLIYYGPQDYKLQYFSREVIQRNHISSSEIIESDSLAKRAIRKVTFDSNGNIIKDENNFFSDWDEGGGTVRGNYEYFYDKSNNLIKSKGTPAEDLNDSIMTISNYNKKGLLFSRERFEFKRKLKPGADRHLPGPNDFEKKPTWNKAETTQFFSTSDSSVIKIFVDGKCVRSEKYILEFDSTNKLKTIKTFDNNSLFETTNYLYDSNSITEILTRKMNDDKDWVYKSKVIIDSNKNQREKMILEHDGIKEVKITTTYNRNGTINEVRYGEKVQTFKYSYYQ